jgi:hypothetical protein
MGNDSNKLELVQYKMMLYSGRVSCCFAHPRLLIVLKNRALSAERSCVI